MKVRPFTSGKYVFDAIEWLNANSGAVQAVATVVLVGITAWYVKLTRDLARTTREQLEHALQLRDEQQKESKTQFRTLIQSLIDTLEEFPERMPPPVPELTSVSLWTPEEELALVTLSARLLPQHAELAGETRRYIAWLRDLVQRTRKRDPKSGQRYGGATVDHYSDFLEGAIKSLEILRTAASSL